VQSHATAASANIITAAAEGTPILTFPRRGGRNWKESKINTC